MLLSDAIAAYRVDRQAKGKARNTIISEQRTLRFLLADVGNLHVSQIGPVQMDRFWASRAAWSANTANLALTQLRTFFKWCAQRGYLPRHADPLEGASKRRVPKVQRGLIPESEWGRVLDLAKHPRDRVIVAFGLYLFLRVSEVSLLRWRDIDFEKNLITVYRPKTDETVVLPLCAELAHELRKWRLEYAAQAGELPRPEWYIAPQYTKPRFTGQQGEGGPLTSRSYIIPTKKLSGITVRVKRVLEVAGYDAKGEGGHTLRRSGATALYHELSEQGHDRAIRLCQTMLGHKSVSTTEIYLSLDLEHKALTDKLAGKPMFTEAPEGVVVELEAGVNEEDVGHLRM